VAPIAVVAHKTGTLGSIRPTVTKALDAIAKHLQGLLAAGRASKEELDGVYDLQLERLAAYSTLLDMPGLKARSTEIEWVIGSPAAARNPMGAAALQFKALSATSRGG
jgi:hypothetical protein